MKKPKSVDEYIAGYPGETESMLRQMRVIIKETVPKAEEVISYNMPAYKLNGILVWFAGQSHHIGFYPKARAIEVFQKELAQYHTSRGTVRFPLDKPLPVKLIKKMLKFRVAENLKKELSR
jgi:uncharacterized protein YdhG (YjbR/CyaY superfamily)